MENKPNNSEENKPVVIDARPNLAKKTARVVHIGTLNLIIRPYQKRHEKLYQERTAALVFDLLMIVFTAVFLAALVFFWNHPITSNRYIDLVIEVTEPQISGTNVDIKIHWQNNNRAKLTDSYISLLPAKEFDINSINFANENWQINDNLIYLGDLEPGASGEINISGKAWVDIENGLSWETRMYYKNLGIRHNKTIDKKIAYDDSLIEANLVVPDKVFAANPFDFELQVSNQSADQIDNLVIKLLTPGTFDIINGDDSFSGDEILIKNLLANSTQTIDLTAQIENLDNSQGQIGFASYLTAGDKTLLQQRSWQSFDFIKPKVDLDLTLDQEQEFYLNEYYNLRFYYYNRESFVLNNARLELVENNSSLDIVYDKDKWILGNIASRQENFINNEFVIRRNRSQVEPVLSLRVKLSWDETTDNGQVYTRYIYSQPISLQVQPNLEVSTKIFYYTQAGDQIGYGPLPPVVGEITSYWLSIHVWPSFGSINDLELTATPGKNVVLDSYNVPLGTINKNNGILWQVDNYNPVDSLAEPRLNIKLLVEPTPDMAGQVVILLDDIKIKGVINNKQIEKKLPLINNNMSDDPLLPNSGIVID